MENREAIHKLESMRNTCQKLIDEKTKFERLVGTDVTETWNAETPFDGACQNLIEAVTMAIVAMKKLEAIQICTPPSDDWEQYADRLHDIAYQSGYEQGKRDADKWTLVSEKMPEEREWIGTKKFGTTMSDEVYVTIEVPSGARITKHMHFQNGSIPPFEQRNLNTFYKGGKAVAWMPLPEPYQEDKA